MLRDRSLVLLSAAILLASAIAAGCGGGGAPVSSPPPPPPPVPAPDFSLALSSSSLNLAQGATSAPVTLTINGSNGFSSPVQITLAGLPAGVASNPSSPFTLTPGSNQAIVFAASSTAATGNFSVSVQGTSGNLNHSAGLSVAVQPALPSRTGYVRLDLGAPGISGGTQHRQVAYDFSRKRVYVANPPGNLVEVLSGPDRKIIARISVPQPVSVDISPDGTKIWAGTAVEQIVSVDPASLEVNGRFALTGLPGPLGTLFSIPQDVVALVGGKLLVSLGRAGATGTRLALWDQATNTLADLTSQAPLSGPGAMARTGDFKQVLVASSDSSGNLVLLDAATGTVIHSAQFPGFLAAVVAANADGSRFAVFLAGPTGSQVVLLNASLNVVALRQAAAVHGLVFSRDARFLYLSENLDLPPVVTVADGATNLQTLGQVADVRLAGVRTQIQDVDETSLLMGAGNRGVSFLDASKPGSLSVTPPVLAGLPSVTPSSGPAAGGTSVVLAGQNFESGAQVAFGGQAASGATVTGGTSIQATSPPAVSPGPVNVTAFFPSGWVALAPDAFSYGPRIVQLLTTAGRPEGGDLVQLLGYGFGADPSQITATLGGKTAAVQAVEDAPAVVQSLGLTAQFPFPLQRLTLAAPAGTPGKADLTITSPAGSATSPAAYQYLQNVRIFPQPGLYKFILYDRARHRIYLSNVDRIEIFDLNASQFLAPLSLPGGPLPSTQLRGLALSPDGAQLAVADFGGQSVYLRTPDVPGFGNRVSVGGVTGFLNSGPARIAVTSTGKAFVAFAASGANGCSQCLGQLINLATPTPTLQAVPQPEVSTLTGSPIVQDAETGQRVFLVFGGAPGGPVAVWNASIDSFATEPGSVSASDLAAAGDGTLLVTAAGSPASAAVLTARNSDLKLVGAAAYQETQLFPGYTPVPGLAVHPSGGLLYRPFLTGAPGSAGVHGGVDILNARSGVLKMRLILPEPLQTDVDALHGSFLTIDEDGKRVFAITNSGLTVVELARVPLSIGSVQPAQGPAAGGTSLTLRGSGFQSGILVALGGATAAVTLVDANTLRVISPALSPGPKRITITNPDGETESLDAGFTAN